MRTALAVLICSGAAMASAAQYAGRPLVSALHDLERHGLHLIYSSEVVRPDLIVLAEPSATEPRAILDALLQQHHLHAVSGPRGTLVIVRDEPSGSPRTSTQGSAPVVVDKIIVTPSHFGILGSQPEQRQFLSRDEVRALPHFSDDIYRAINRIPGAATNDVSASFRIRGGDEDETEVLLDGVQIYEPFHVKDVFNVFSTLDAETMGAVDVLTGGFPAEYGGRMSGVIDITSLTPSERRTEIGISILNSRALTAGTFGKDKGQWLLSFRPGYLHEVLQMTDTVPDIDPSYYDLFGKLQWQLSDASVVSANILASHDRLTLNASDVQARVRSGDHYLWLNLRSAVAPRVFMQTVVSAGGTSDERHGTFVEQSERGRLDAQRSSHFVALRNDTTFAVNPRQTFKAGLRANRMHTGFDYNANTFDQYTIFDFNKPNTIDRVLNLSASGTDVAVYAADRVSITPNLVLEAGLRADRQSYTPDGTHVTPRLNAGWAITPSTTVRIAWGRFAQSQRVDELPVPEGITAYSPAQFARHAVAGIDHRFSGGWSARIEAYEKRLSHLRPRFLNVLDPLTFFPELRSDRTVITPSGGRAAGVEFLLRKDSNGPWSGWLTYVRSTARDDVDGRRVPVPWDQRDAVGFSINYGYPGRWNVNLAGTYHSGWPTTSLSGSTTPLPGGGYRLTTALGPLNGDRLPAYQRVDLRASRSVAIGSNRLNLFFDVMNLLDHSNVSRVDSFSINVARDGSVTTSRRTTSIIPLLPSFGVSWQF